MTIMARVALSLGIWLWLGYGYGGRWLKIKLLLVLGLIGYHLACRVLRAAACARGAPLPERHDAAPVQRSGAAAGACPSSDLAVVKPF